MNTHVKVVGWLWIANGVVTILMAIIILFSSHLADCVVSFPESLQILQLASACLSTCHGLASWGSFWRLSICFYPPSALLWEFTRWSLCLTRKLRPYSKAKSLLLKCKKSANHSMWISARVKPSALSSVLMTTWLTTFWWSTRAAQSIISLFPAKKQDRHDTSGDQPSC